MSYTQLTREQRYQIYALMKAGHDQTRIAEIVSCHKSTISRELARNRGQRGYRPKQAHEIACARQRADWLFGINLTRLYTVLGRAGGYDGVLSVGRVQTPLLGLIVRRDSEIEAFRRGRTSW